MPNITKVYSREKLAPAALKEGFSDVQAEEILTDAADGWDQALINYIQEQGITGGLEEFRKAFPNIFNSGDDRVDSFLIRVAAIAEGGLAV